VDSLHDREERLVRLNRPTHEPRHRRSGPPRVGGTADAGRRARDLRVVAIAADDVEDAEQLEAHVEEERSA
jgi:hypothetical protein